MNVTACSSCHLQTHIEGCQYSKFQCGLCGKLLANGEVIIHCQILYTHQYHSAVCVVLIIIYICDA